MQRALAVHIVKQGLQSGLTKFFGRATRAALIYSYTPEDPGNFLVYDTMGLLEKYRSQIQSYFLTDDAVKSNNRIQSISDTEVRAIEIADGLYVLVHQSKEVFFHMWFVERHQSESPPSLLDQWIRFAQLPLLRPDAEMTIGTQIGGGRLAEHAAFDVVRKVIMEQMFPLTLQGGDADAEIVLESLMEIATVKEEGSGCSGSLAIFDRDPAVQPRVDYPLKSPVAIDKFKHVRKFLTATSDDYHLVAIAGNIVGFSHKDSLQSPLLAQFEKGRLTLTLKSTPLCQVSNGTFGAIESKWSLDIQNETKALSKLEDATKIRLQEFVNRLVTTARNEHFGCTLLLDSGKPNERRLSGQKLEIPVPLSDSTFKLFADMCKVDGAVHIDVKDLTLCAFACLLDGESGDTEELSRGARFNSAQRYSRKTENTVVLVVSEDGPVTIFEDGAAAAVIEKYVRDHECKHAPPRLADWLRLD